MKLGLRKDWSWDGVASVFLVIVVVLCMISVQGLLRRGDRNKQNLQAQFDLQVQRARIETKDPCSRLFFRILKPSLYIGRETTVVVAGEVVEPGAEDAYHVQSEDEDTVRFYLASDDPYFHDLVRKREFSKQCRKNAPAKR